MRKLDLKTYIIIILGVALIISFIFGQKNVTNKHADEISVLHKNNIELLKKNDSLLKVNKIIDIEISKIHNELKIKTKSLIVSQKELDKLNLKKYENNTYVKHLSSNGVSVALSNYIDNRVKGSNNR